MADAGLMFACFGCCCGHTNNGAARDNIQWNELEKREIILQCFFNSDSYRIVSETAGAIAHYFEPNELLQLLAKHLRIVHYEERRERNDGHVVAQVEGVGVKDHDHVHVPGELLRSVGHGFIASHACVQT